MGFFSRIFTALGQSKPANAQTKQAPSSGPTQPTGTVTSQATTAARPPKSLLEVVKDGDVAAAQQSLEQGADVNAANSIGETPLIRASFEGHADVVRLLLAAGAKVDAAVNNGATALFVASQNGHAGVVKLLLAAKANVDAARRSDGSTSLLAASGEGHADVVKLLLAAGADITIAVDDGTTPLEIASHCGHADVIQLLTSGLRRGGLGAAVQPGHKCERHREHEMIGACHCGHVICKECIRRLKAGPSIRGGQGFHVGCVWCLPHGERPPQEVIEFMERDFIRRAGGR